MLPLYRSILNKIHRRGTVDIAWPNGVVDRFGDGSEPRAAVRLSGAMTPLRIAVNPVLGLGEAYMDGTLSLEGETDILSLLKVAATNLEWSPDNPNFSWAQTGRRFGGAFRQLNRLKKARENVAHHYDLTDELFDLFLDPRRQYSCAYFRDPGMSLEDAQLAKMNHIAAKLRLDRPDLTVLEIGCGWGGLAMHLAREKGARVHAITLSKNQQDYAIARVREAGLEDRVSIDYRDYREVTGQYDRVVSIAMFEAVGRPNYRAYFEAAWRALKPDGLMMMHTIGRVDGPGDTDPWIDKYIFPGGYSPALSEMLPHIERAGFYTTDIEIWRMHYAKTLREWYRRCAAAKDRIVAMHDERFYRMWMFYLAACVMAFEHLAHVVFQIQLQKKVEGPAPLTRDYLYS